MSPEEFTLLIEAINGVASAIEAGAWSLFLGLLVVAVFS